MSDMSDYLENKLIDLIFRNRSFSPPSTIYVGLYTAAPSDSGGGTEVSGGSYARVQVGPSDGTWDATQGGNSGASSGTGGATANSGAITFPTPSANWGSITHVGIFDASSAGNLLFWKALTQAKTVNNGDPAPSFATGALDVVLA
jgi:hypothetical protein